MSEWLDCYDWLVQCHLINSPIYRKHPSVLNGNYQILSQEIASALKDGTALCNFLNNIQDKSVFNFSNMPCNSQCLMKKNIGAFLFSLKEVFNISETDLFTVEELYSKLNLNKVLYTLSILSQHHKVRLRYKPFVLQRSHSYVSNEDYQNIGTDDFNEDDIYSYNLAPQDIEQEKIYGRIMDIKRPSNTTKKTMREMSDEELLKTEEKFLDVLTILNEDFNKPLKKVMSSEDHSIIFKYVEELFHVHCDFYAMLLKTTIVDSGLCSADCFITFKHKFLLYGEFCAHIPIAQACIDDILKSNSPVKTAIEVIQTNCKIDQCKLRDLFVLPMQRLLRYQLLIKSMIDNITEKCTDRKQLQMAYEEIQDLALFVNEMKRDKEMLKNLKQIEESIHQLQMPSDTHLSDYGRLIKDGEMKYKNRQDPSKNLYIFLFDKLILICKSKQNHYDYNSFLVLPNLNLKDEKDKTVFVMVEKEKMDEWHSFKCKNADEKEKWLDAIKMAKENVEPDKHVSQKYMFRMATFEKPTICDVCRKLLRGAFFQGYKCSKSKLQVHKECISKAGDATGPSNLPRRLSLISPVVQKKQPLQIKRQTSYFSKPNIQIDELEPWYAGEVDRLAAIDILEKLPNASYLIRFSAKENKYVLGIMYQKAVFIIIQENSTGFFLEEGSIKPTIPELIQHYQEVTLGTSFNSLPICLLFPFKQMQKVIKVAPKNKNILGYCLVNFDFTPMESNRLKLCKGDIVTILDKAGEANGWWKGYLSNKIAYFPYAYTSYC